jgi:hypothetical protein
LQKQVLALAAELGVDTYPQFEEGFSCLRLKDGKVISSLFICML